MLSPGDLVRVRHSSSHTYVGIVAKYEPDVNGGSCAVSNNTDSQCWVNTTPVRGQALVVDTQDGGSSWCDEINLTLLEST